MACIDDWAEHGNTNYPNLNMRKALDLMAPRHAFEADQLGQQRALLRPSSEVIWEIGAGCTDRRVDQR
jgi:hypothetical protein